MEVKFGSIELQVKEAISLVNFEPLFMVMTENFIRIMEQESKFMEIQNNFMVQEDYGVSGDIPFFDLSCNAGFGEKLEHSFDQSRETRNLQALRSVIND